MLTLRQLLIVSGPAAGGALTTDILRARHPVRPLSVASVAHGVEQQRLALFVTLASTRIFTRHPIASMDELAQAARTVDGIVQPAEILALSAAFKQQGISLRLINHLTQTFVLVALVPSLVDAPVTVVNSGNLIQIRDKFSGAEAVGGITAGVGGLIIGIAVTVSAPVWVLPVGAFLLGFGVGVGITAGIMDIAHDSTPPPRSDSQQNIITPNDLGPDGPPGESIEVPNAVVIGTPNGVNVDGILRELGDFSVDFSVDMILADLPTGFDPITDGIPSGGVPGDGGDGGLTPIG